MARVENPCLHKREVENCSNTQSFFRYRPIFFLIEVQKALQDNFFYLIISPRPVDATASSSSSINVKLLVQTMQFLQKGF